MNPPPPFNCEVFSPCWCSVAGRENNPHCKTGLSIQSDLFAFLLVAGMLSYMLFLFYRKPRPLTEVEIEDNLKWKLFWISLKDRWIFRPNAFYKEYFKKNGSLKNKYKKLLTK